jgi:cytidine deaminase
MAFFSDPNDPIWETLLDAAWRASIRGYAPYSGIKEGAALLLESGRIVSGWTVENPSGPLTQCAGRVALAMAVNHGLKSGGMLALALFAERMPPPPCAACRQVLAEFGPYLPVLLASRHERELWFLDEPADKAFPGGDSCRP